jgi:hypothetical protein
VCTVVDSTVCDAVLACSSESVAAFGAYGITSSFVFVVGSHILQGGVQPDAVVFGSGEVEFGLELARVGDLLEVRPLALDMSEQGLDPCLVLGLSG